MYWVISGSMLVRQRIVDIIEDQRDDGEACTGLVLDPRLVPLAGRPTKPFQGWRYLRPDEAPRRSCRWPARQGRGFACRRHCGANCRCCVCCEIRLRNSVKP